MEEIVLHRNSFSQIRTLRYCGSMANEVRKMVNILVEVGGREEKISQLRI